MPSIHSAPPFFTSVLPSSITHLSVLISFPLRRRQPNPATQAVFTEQWTRLLLAYARHRGLFVLRTEDAEVSSGSEWDEVLRNPRINRGSSIIPSPLFTPFPPPVALVGRIDLITSTGRLNPALLAHVLGVMVGKNLAVYDAPKQTRSILLYWRLPEEWAEVLHEWVRTPLPDVNTFFRGSHRFSIPSSLSTLGVAVSLAGDVDGAVEYDPDVVRDLQPSCADCSLGDP